MLLVLQIPPEPKPIFSIILNILKYDRFAYEIVSIVVSSIKTNTDHDSWIVRGGFSSFAIEWNWTIGVWVLLQASMGKKFDQNVTYVNFAK